MNSSTRHGFAMRGRNRTPEYNAWSGMNARCHCETNKLFSYYGARGITVCPEWRGAGGFLKFLAHIGRRPGPGYSIDRIENDRGYEPGNVRWATRVQQMENTRRTRLVTIDGETLPLKRWCERRGLPYKAVHLRITRRGMEPVAALAMALRGCA